MHWHQLLPKLQLAMMGYPSPDMIIIHVGGNDITSVKQGKFIKMIKKDINYLASVFPRSMIVWSDILPRFSWRGLDSSVTAFGRTDEKHKRVNRAGRQVIRSLNLGRSIIHEIEIKANGLFLADGVHLSPVGNDIFLNTISEAILSFYRNKDNAVFNANT